MALARITAQRSTCFRRAVGAVLLDRHGFILSTGYNGVGRGMPHCNEARRQVRLVGDDWVPNPDSSRVYYPHACAGAAAASGEGLDLCEAIHAEQNALLQCERVQEIKTCYVTVSPCVTCTKLLLNTSCEAIFFDKPYAHDETASALWLRAGRLWEKFSG